MRNLKRALSLTLASVMLLGMMVVGAGAASYPDVTDENNVEAIEVLQAVKVMEGDSAGNFDPDRPVSRAEMAVIMALLLNLDYDYYRGTKVFNDVPDWCAPYVAACYANGIIAGYNATTYGSADTVNAVQAASMMMRALGYFKFSSDYKGDFILSTVTQASKINLFDQINANATDPLTRNQVAQLALNTLKSAIVEPEDNTLNIKDGDGNIIATGGQVNYVVTASQQAYARAIDDAESDGSALNGVRGYIVELGEQLYNGKLKLHDNRTDDFDRPSRTWEYDGKEIGTFVKKEQLKETYTDEVTGKMLYELLSKETVDKYDFLISIDGVEATSANKGYLSGAYFTEGNLVRTNTEAVGGTGKGVETQVYVDTDNHWVYISIINTYLAKATRDYNAKKDEVTFKVWGVKNATGSNTNVVLVKDAGVDGTDKTLDVKGEDFTIKDVKDGDIYLVHVADGEIKEFLDPKVIDNTEIDTFKKESWVRAGETQYDYADAIRYDPEVLDAYDDSNMKDTTYRIFLDKYGYAIGVEIVEAKDNYAFLTGIDLDRSNLANKVANGNLIFTDGTMDTVEINMEDSENSIGHKFSNTSSAGTQISALMNTWCKYSVDSRGRYTLTEIANGTADSRNAGKQDFITDSKGASYTNSKTDKVGQGWDKHDGVGGKITVLDKSHIYLSSAITNYSRTYASDDTVIIVAELDKIRANRLPNGAQADAIIISGVDSVTTGIDNVSLDVWDRGTNEPDPKDGLGVITNSPELGFTYDGTNGNRNTVSMGVYSLFNDDGEVIAAVVVGEDNGSTSNYVYVTSSETNREHYNKTDDTYEWSREAIVDGELKDLVETASSNPDIAKMVQGNWYEVKYKGDGTVRKVMLDSTATGVTDNLGLVNTAITGSPSYSMPAYDFGTTTSTAQYIAKIEDVVTATDANEGKTVVLWDNMMDDTYKISYSAGSLWVQTSVTNKSGFRVAKDVKTVLIQDVKPTNKNLKVMDYISDTYVGNTALSTMIDDLESNSSFKGFIGAIFEGKVATSVIIYDKTATPVDQGNNDVDPNVTAVYQDNATGDVTITYTGTAPGRMAQLKAVTDALEKAAKDIYGTGTSVKVDTFTPAVAGGAMGSYNVTIVRNGVETTDTMSGRILMPLAGATTAGKAFSTPSVDSSTGIMYGMQSSTTDLDVSAQSYTFKDNTVNITSGLDKATNSTKQINGTAISSWVSGADDMFIVLELKANGITKGQFKTRDTDGTVGGPGTFDYTVNPGTVGYDPAHYVFGWDASDANDKTKCFVDVQWKADGSSTWSEWTRIWFVIE